MNGNEHLRQTLEYYRQQRQKKLEELRPIDTMIRNLEKDLGEAPAGGEETGERSGLPMPDVFDNDQIIRNHPVIRDDEFYGMSQSDAAKAYLKKVRRAVSIDQLVEGMKNGGARVGGVDPKKTLYVSLMRNPLKEFVAPKEGFMGLREFYPNLPKSVKPAWGKKKKSKSKSKKRSRSPKQKSKSKEARTPKSAPAKVVSPVMTAIKQVLSDGKPRSKEQVFNDVQERLGHKVAKIAVYGALRAKDFSESGGQVSLVQ